MITTLEQLKKDIESGKYTYTNESASQFIDDLRDSFGFYYKDLPVSKIVSAQEMAWEIVCGDSFIKAFVWMKRLCNFLDGKNPFKDD